ncbi:phosphoenolpyruvate--protein phosphotransferase [Ruminococcus champanellensis]|uniref:phosphoenolpyruvate--protein phosphotransferase n=1 Tax=Ruminococcus champanellensis TaxID=1161942 RepID=UPI002E7A0C1C|nr:phosphoenolpyruvate--protein phosphotransferase [Ruminococcus champanellensis]MED9891177.1 phosphoenolpyruvate--protein phosphotransferase [Ruminococcus champanellensis]
MNKIQGKGVCGAVTMGKLYFYKKDNDTISRKTITDPEAEQQRFDRARQQAAQELDALHEKALREVGEIHAQIFEIHRMMLEDEDYCSSVSHIIHTQRVNAEYAVLRTSDSFSQMFSTMTDEYMQARAADVVDISNRLIRCLNGGNEESLLTREPVILVAEDLTPSETVQLDKEKILAFLTLRGSENSHTAILARTMAIPAVVGLGQLDPAMEGKTAIVDGFTGTVCIDPDAEAIAAYTRKKQQEEEKHRLWQSLRGKSNTTRDGRSIRLYANIGGLDDISAALQNDAGGIGLFRSEFLYLQNDHMPTEEEQFRAYREAAEKLAGKPVIIRTMDIGADKQIDYFHLPKEENPALGYRAIRICLSEPELFRTQLRALYRAGVYGDLSIMFPMITSPEEIRHIQKQAELARQELQQQEIPFREHMETGIMIETPAAAVISDILAPMVDFFSIGTNDLTQYALAIDRQNPSLEAFYQPHHEAVLRLIHQVIRNAHKAGIWAGICGELGADPALTERFLRMGVDELSVSPAQILPIREKIRSMDLRQ